MFNNEHVRGAICTTQVHYLTYDTRRYFFRGSSAGST